MSEAVLEVSKVSKRFGALQVLDSVNLSLQPGEVLGLLGRNGAGKTTLLACLSGSLVPDSGTVQIAGYDLFAAPVLARAALRYLPQDLDLPQGVTGEELIAIIASVFAGPGSQKAPDLDAARELAELGPMLAHLASSYSYGMKKRLWLGCLMLGHGQLFVLDEPFSGLDRESKDRLFATLLARKQRGAAILLSAQEDEGPELERLGASFLRLG